MKQAAFRQVPGEWHMLDRNGAERQKETNKVRKILSSAAGGANKGDDIQVGGENPLEKILTRYLPEFKVELKNVHVRYSSTPS